MPDLKSLWQHWHFGLCLSLAIVVYQITTALIFITLTPNGYSWNGANITNSSDTAVYLSYLTQGKDRIILTNFYNNFPQTPRFDPFWSLFGQLAKIGLSPILIYEILRYLAGFLFGFTIYATAKSIINDKKRARFISLLTLSGLTMGWIFYCIALFFKINLPNSPADLVTEFSLIQMINAAPHILFSFCLMLMAVRLVYQSFLQNKPLLFAGFLILIQTSFHPYFIPFYGILSILLTVAAYKKLRLQAIKKLLTINIFLIPSAIYYIFLIFKDNRLRSHHLVNNQLPLDPWYFWPLILLPVLFATIWLIKNKNHNNLNIQWSYFWIASAIICMILPFPWTRKYTQGLSQIFVLATLPFWLMFYEKFIKQNSKLFIGALIFIIFTPYLFILNSQIQTAINSNGQYLFYFPDKLIRAWQSIPKDPDNLIITTNIRINLWTPRYANNKVYIGHAHETPDFSARQAEFDSWRQTDSSVQFNQFLDNNQITHLITLNPADTETRGSLLSDNWLQTFYQDGISIWQRQN
ncbi:MAG: hypothetical protein ACOYUZ_03600 [Patescibacteria group bacterium]